MNPSQPAKIPFEAPGAKVVLFVSPSGIPQAVEVDGIRITHVKNARVVLDPGEVLTLHLEIYAGSVATGSSIGIAETS